MRCFSLFMAFARPPFGGAPLLIALTSREARLFLALLRVLQCVLDLPCGRDLLPVRMVPGRNRAFVRT